MEGILQGKTGEMIYDRAYRNISGRLSVLEGIIKPISGLLVDPADYDSMRLHVIDKMMAAIPSAARGAEKYLDEKMNIADTLYSRMKALEPEAFEGLLRTAFKEDEMILFLVGSALGFIVGILQAALLT